MALLKVTCFMITCKLLRVSVHRSFLILVVVFKKSSQSLKTVLALGRLTEVLFSAFRVNVSVFLGEVLSSGPLLVCHEHFHM